MQFKLVYENAQDGMIYGSVENIPTDNDTELCKRDDLENRGLVYETRDENDSLVIMASEDHLPGGDDDCQVYPMVKETPKPDPNPEEGGAGGTSDNGGTGVGGETETPKVEE